MRARIQQANDAAYAAWNAHDADGVATLFAPDGEILDVISGVTTKGRAEIRGAAEARFLAFADFSLERRNLLIDANTNSDQWVLRATHTGEYMGLPATGRVLEVHGATFAEYNEDCLIVRNTHYVDVPALLRQLGLE